MNSELLTRARQVVPDTGVLVNLVRLRVRQLTAGHRPLLQLAPGIGIADTALHEVIAGKINIAPAPENFESVVPAAVIAFPGQIPKEKAA